MATQAPTHGMLVSKNSVESHSMVLLCFYNGFDKFHGRKSAKHNEFKAISRFPWSSYARIIISEKIFTLRAMG